MTARNAAGVSAEATGALGRHLVPALVAAGHEVTATTRTPGQVAQLREAGGDHGFALSPAAGIPVRCARASVAPQTEAAVDPVRCPQDKAYV